MIGQTLHNRFRVTAQLGKGAMGLVYRATDRQTKQDVALKVIARELALDKDMLERFRREGEALRTLRHPNIVGFVEMFEHQGQHVIVMEYVPGGSLHALIRQGAVPLEHARRIALELCDALTRAHHLNIIHRDIKPENVLLAEDGTPRLTDFGVARLLEAGTRLTGTGTQVGTPYYMSPEAWEGKPLDGQADVWSLGVVLYEMLAGQVPFGGDTSAAVMTKVLMSPLPDLRTLCPDVPEGLVHIVERALTRDKAQRYKTVRQMGADLELVELPAAPVRPTAIKPEPPPMVIPPKAAPAALPRQTPPPSPAPATPSPAVGDARDTQVTTALKPRILSGRILALGGAAALVVICALVAGGLGLWAVAGKLRAPAGLPTAAAQAPTTPPTSAPALAATLPPTDTPVPPTATPALGIGSTQVSSVDGMVQVYVPAGDFLMGSTDADRSASSDEKPQHTVYLDAYWIDQTEVTNAMFAQFVTAANYKTEAERNGSGYAFRLASGDWASTTGANWRHPLGPSSSIDGRGKDPVVQVSWTDASAYCQWAGRQLPTEAQWEKAARGTDGRIYPWGNEPPDSSLLNFNMQAKGTTEVGRYPAGASPYGALDMAGNVWEWVADLYGSSYYVSSPSRNPTGPGMGPHHLLRGGSWVDVGSNVRAAIRYWLAPQSALIPWFDFGGFRCAGSSTNTAAPTPPSAPTPTVVSTLAVSAAAATPNVGSTQISSIDGMNLLYVPAGNFLMGSTDSDSQAKGDEKPQHTVYLDAFWIDQVDVTNAMYAKCVASGKCQPPSDASSQTRSSYYGNSQYDRYPVIYVSWDDATAYCAWAGRRLPTEAEWEKAARGTDGRIYPWGNQAPDATRANYGQTVGDTTEVGKYLAGANPYGALDMAGNVWQWVNDWYSDTYYSSSPDRNPPGPTSGQRRVLRGGSWIWDASAVRAASRHWNAPDLGVKYFGFRCVR